MYVQININHTYYVVFVQIILKALLLLFAMTFNNFKVCTVATQFKLKNLTISIFYL